MPKSAFEAVNEPFAEGRHLRCRVDAPADERQKDGLFKQPCARGPYTDDERNGHERQRDDEQHAGYSGTVTTSQLYARHQHLEGSADPLIGMSGKASADLRRKDAAQAARGSRL